MTQRWRAAARRCWAPAVVLLALALTALSFYENRFGIAPRNLFPTYQFESESLVLGKIVADRSRSQIGRGAHLGYASVGPYVYDSAHMAETYSLVEAEAPPARSVKLADLTDGDWTAGVGRRDSAVAVEASDPFVSRYLGRPAVLPDGTRRVVSLIRTEGPLTFIHFLGPPVAASQFSASRSLQLTGGPIAARDLQYFPYVSQYGLQGTIYSWLANDVGLDLKRLYRIQVVAVTGTLLVLAFLFRRIYGTAFAVMFFATLAVSPWFTLFARNLYWAPYLWFLPAIAVALHYLERRPAVRIAWLGAFYLLVLAKCLAGYEFVSTIIWFAASVYLIAPFLPERRYSLREAAVQFAVVCAVATAAFLTALVIHAHMRSGGSVLEGLRAIYEEDVRRRTYAVDTAGFAPLVQQALAANPLQVAATYVFSWSTGFIGVPINFLPGLRGWPFFPLAVLAALGAVAVSFLRRAPTARRDLAMLAAFAGAPMSWFVLAKAHSYIHTHMNYVLWCFGLIAALFYAMLNGARALLTTEPRAPGA